MRRTKKIKQSWDNRLFSVIVYVVVLGLTIVCIVPFLNILAISVSSNDAVQRGEVFLVPKNISFIVYETILNNKAFLRSMIRSILITLGYVVVGVSMTICCAYPLSEPDLKGKNAIMKFIMFTMYFSGGMIPIYIVVNSLGLIDSYLALILPCALSTYNMIVMRSFFVGVPMSLREAARIDGAGDFKILVSVIVPLSKPVLATISLFYAVAKWNAVTDALLYINDPAKKVLQVYLKQLIQSVEGYQEMARDLDVPPVLETVRAGSLIVGMIPILIIYPFLQRYFVKGMTIGSVKG